MIGKSNYAGKGLFMDESLKRSVPHSLAAERAVIGSMILDNDAVNVCSEILTKDDFYQKLYGKLFQTIVDLNNSNQAVDEITIVAAMGDMELGVDIEALIKELVMEVPTSVNAKDYAKVVKDKSILRNIIRVGQSLERRCYEEWDNVDDILADSEADIFSLNQLHGDTEDTSIKQIVLDELTAIETAAKNKGQLSGVASGFMDLDRVTQGFQKGDLIIVAARPAMGKTAFVLNIAAHIGIELKKRVAVFSLEMPKGQLARRLMAQEGHVDSKKMKAGTLTEMDWELLIQAAAKVGCSNIILDDAIGGLTPQKLRRKCRKLAADGELSLIIIDYLQLMNGDGRADNRQVEVSQISRSLKMIAKELNVPIIALSQLSRSVEDRTDKHPMISDLRESGAIEQDADIIMFLYRDDYYNHDSENKNTTELIIGKHRSGELATIELAWLPEYTKFANKEYVHHD